MAGFGDRNDQAGRLHLLDNLSSSESKGLSKKRKPGRRIWKSFLHSYSCVGEQHVYLRIAGCGFHKVLAKHCCDEDT
jgi:hypothetical protein